MQSNGKFELMQRCIKQLENTMTLEERIKILRVLASTANKMAEDLETVFETN
jgi:hypothetical protein